VQGISSGGGDRRASDLSRKGRARQDFIPRRARGSRRGRRGTPAGGCPSLGATVAFLGVASPATSQPWMRPAHALATSARPRGSTIRGAPSTSRTMSTSRAHPAIAPCARERAGRQRLRRSCSAGPEEPRGRRRGAAGQRRTPCRAATVARPWETGAVWALPEF
jgi:hypothetical protein